MSENVAATIDLSGMPCPAPLLGAKKLFDDLRPGETLWLISDCSGAYDDLSAWCRYTGNVLLSTMTQAGGKVAYRLYKSRREQTTPSPHVTLDLRGISCPGPIVEAKRLLEGMKSSEVLRLVTDCTAAIDDVPLWSHATSIEFLLALELANGAQEFFLRKT